MHNLTKKYGHITAVHNLDLEMEKGVYGLLGVNGAGKTTLIRMLCTLSRPTSGSITYDGEDIFRMGGRYREMLGYLPQDFGYYPDLSVWDYLMYIASLKGIRPAPAKSRTNELLYQVGLERKRKAKMRTLSGGMLRRVGMAQALLNDPGILVLDEPTAGLDPKERIRFRNLVSGLASDRIVLLSTHIVSDIEYIANQIIMMDKGEAFRTGTPDEIVDSISGRAWNCLVPREKVGKWEREFLVANMKTTPQGAQLRVLADEPPMEGAVPEPVTLEDAFLYYFGEKDGGHEAAEI